MEGACYVELLRNCGTFNGRIGVERRHRMPFLDVQTGIAQSASNLWRLSRERRAAPLDGDQWRPGGGFLYHYPAKRWRCKPHNSCNLLALDAKRRRLSAEMLITREASGGGQAAVGGGVAGDVSVAGDCSLGAVADEQSRGSQEMGGEKQSTTEQRLEHESTGRVSSHGDTVTPSTYKWYDEMGVAVDATLDDSFVDDHGSDGDDFDDRASARRKRSKKSRTRKPKDLSADRPHKCTLCGARYKTKPGLHYHMSHQHPDVAPGALAPVVAAVADAAPSPGSASATPAPAPTPASQSEATAPLLCDFCLGDSLRNNKTLQAEQLVACKDCGRAGHPTCLQFTPNMILSTARHGWQCIDCKSCAVCGTSENDDQLLFCDDCDRGFHMYCLKPALLSAPEGSWSCHLCIVEFGSSASNPAAP